MILINLLPHREAARQRQRRQFMSQAGLVLLAAVLSCFLAMLAFVQRIDHQRARNDLLQAEIALLDAQIQEVASLQSQLEALEARQRAVESLQADRNLPVHLLNEMVRQVPDGVYLSALKQDGASIVLTGMAQSQERVSELLRNLGGHSEWLRQPQLVEIVAADVNVPQRGSRRVSNFSIRVMLMHSQEESVPQVGQPSARQAAKV